MEQFGPFNNRMINESNTKEGLTAKPSLKFSLIKKKKKKRPSRLEKIKSRYENALLPVKN